MAENRLARELEGRDSTARPTSWKPPALLPDPAPSKDWKYRWVRISTMGQQDPTNASAAFREGWEPCKAADHPELMMHVDPHSTSRFKDNIEIGGLLLCKMQAEKVEQRRKYYETMANDQIQAVDNSYLRQSDPRMPMDKLGPAIERKTRVSFGRGNQS
jgi:hypothetical protein